MFDCVICYFDANNQIGYVVVLLSLFLVISPVGSNELDIDDSGTNDNSDHRVLLSIKEHEAGMIAIELRHPDSPQRY